MSYSLRCLIVAFLVLPFYLQAQTESFRLGYFELPPHTQTETGRAGPAVHYFDKIAARMQVEIHSQVLPLSRLLKQLENNELDAALILAKSTERKLFLVYPKQPFFITSGALAVRAGLPNDADSFLADQSYRIAIWQHGYHPNLLKNFAGRFVLLSGDNISARAAEMLGKDRVDAFYEPDIYALRHSIQHNQFGSQLNILELHADKVPIYTVFSRQGAEKFLQRYEQAQRRQAEEISYLDYLNQWLEAPAVAAK